MSICIHRISWTLVSRETRGILVVIEHHRSKCATCAAIMHEKRSRENLSIVDDQFATSGTTSVSLVSRWFSFPRSSARTSTSRYGQHNNAWRNSGVESSLPPPCNDVTGKWNSRKPGHTHIVLAVLSRDAGRRETPFNSGLDAFPSVARRIARQGDKIGFTRANFDPERVAGLTIVWYFCLPVFITFPDT